MWDDLDGFSEGFKAASTGNDGKQYMVPLYNYPWAVHYSKSLFEEKGYTPPTTWDELIALADQMKADGIIPFSLGNDGKWPAMGTFDILNMRINGYDFHVSLMAGEEDWTSAEVKDVFAQYATLLPYHQEGANGRTWQEAAQTLKAHETGMMMLGTFISRAVRRRPRRPRLLPLPGAQRHHGTDSIDAPIDGFMMAADPNNEAAAKEVLAYLGERRRPATIFLTRRTPATSPPTATPTRRPTRRSTRRRPS